jgi:hypothetical protein
VPSEATGVDHIALVTVESPSPLVALIPFLLWFPCTVGVGQDEDAFSSMWRTHVGRSKHIPLRIVPARGQVSENCPESTSNESCDVFHEDETGSKNANDSRIFRPQPRASAADALSRASVADVLAREAATDEVNTFGSFVD